MLPNQKQSVASNILAQMSKTQLQHLIDTSESNPVCRNEVFKECRRRAEGYEQICRFSGTTMIACLAFILLVKLLQ